MIRFCKSVNTVCVHRPSAWLSLLFCCPLPCMHAYHRTAGMCCRTFPQLPGICFYYLGRAPLFPALWTVLKSDESTSPRKPQRSPQPVLILLCITPSLKSSSRQEILRFHVLSTTQLKAANIHKNVPTTWVSRVTIEHGRQMFWCILPTSFSIFIM